MAYTPPQYASLTDYATYGLVGTGYRNITDPKRTAALIAASTMLEDALASQFVCPIVAPYPPQLITYTCFLADEILVTQQGLSLEGDGNKVIWKRADAARKWAEDVANDRVHPQGIIDSRTVQSFDADLDADTRPPRCATGNTAPGHGETGFPSEDD